MKAAYINQPGPPESIIVGELPKPQPTGGQVLVKVAAVAVNPIDTYIRSGTVKMDMPLPFIVGCDLAGTVEAVGPEAQSDFMSAIEFGHRIKGCSVGKGRLPSMRPSTRSGSIRRQSGVSRRNGRRLRPRVAHRSRWIGRATQRCSRAKCCSSTAAPAASARWSCRWPRQSARRSSRRPAPMKRWPSAVALGADLAINYKTEDVPARIREFAPGGINVWWETLREPNFDRTDWLLAPRGRMILMAGRDARPPFPVGPFYVKGCKLYGFAMFNATVEEIQAAGADINRWLAAGQLKARIDRVLPLDRNRDGPSACRKKARSANRASLAGKIVVRP